MITRRKWMMGSVAAAAATQIASGAGKNIVVASGNGQQACARAMEVMRGGGDTLDAVITGVNLVEEDPNDTSVGYGGLPNEAGDVELDACVMHGPSRRAGSVASLRGIKTPSKVARLVMEQTDHIMMVADGALQFAKAHGFQEEDLLTDRARKAWLLWKQSQRDSRDRNNWLPGLDAPPANPNAHLRRLFPDGDDAMLAWAAEVVAHPPTGTISCLALNEKGEMSGVTTTSGLAWKIPGRVGDSPIIGAGLYVDQDVGAAGSTGRGEENIRVAGAHTVVENMRHGMSAKEAVTDCLKRVARNYDNELERLHAISINFYALRNDGDFAGGSLWNATRSRTGELRPRTFTYDDGAGSRSAECFSIYERK